MAWKKKAHNIKIFSFWYPSNRTGVGQQHHYTFNRRCIWICPLVHLSTCLYSFCHHLILAPCFNSTILLNGEITQGKDGTLCSRVNVNGTCVWVWRHEAHDMKMTLLPSPLSRAASEGFFPWGLYSSPSPDFPGSVRINTSLTNQKIHLQLETITYFDYCWVMGTSKIQPS